VRIEGYTQAIVDREIAYASAGGIDYWAFLLYEPDSPMSQGLSLYLSSRKKRDIAFCAIASPGTFGSAQAFGSRMERIVKLMAEPTYQKVANGRPLLYLFDMSDAWIEALGGPANAKRLFDDFRAAVERAGYRNPYLVVMDFSPAHGKEMAERIGAEAISAYTAPGAASCLSTTS